jgi:hypothetical protein
MFEFAAGQVQQEERERKIAEGLRRRELLAAAASDPEREMTQRPVSTIQHRAQTPSRAQAGR